MNTFTAVEITPEIYTGFITEIEHSPFHRLEWLDLVKNFYSVELILLGYFNGSELIAVSPLLKRKVGPIALYGAPLRKCAIPPATSFCIPVEKSLDVIQALRYWCNQNKIIFLQVTLPNDIDPSNVICDNVEKLNNLEMNLTDPLENIYKKYSKGTKWCIRKSVRMGVRLHWRNSIDAVEEQKLLLNETYGNERNQANSNYPVEFYKVIFNKKDKLSLRILSASYNGKTLASLWVFFDKNTCYYWDAASRFKARDFYANHLLVWCLIRWAHKNGLNTFDFVGGKIGGAGGSRPGIGKFKRSMGGEPYTYHILYWYSPILRIALNGYRLYSAWHRKIKSLISGKK